MYRSFFLEGEGGGGSFQVFFTADIGGVVNNLLSCQLGLLLKQALKKKSKRKNTASTRLTFYPVFIQAILILSLTRIRFCCFSFSNLVKVFICTLPSSTAAYLYYSLSSKIKRATNNYDQNMYNTVITARSDGNIRWMTSAFMFSGCALDYRLFPFDTQNCSLIFSPWTMSSRIVSLPGL
jgi:hypothetical protein